MRKKTGQSVDVAAVTAAWDNFLRNESTQTKESLNNRGWKTRDDLIALGLGWRDVAAFVISNKLEKKMFRIKCNKISRSVAFYRPKI